MEGLLAVCRAAKTLPEPDTRLPPPARRRHDARPDEARLDAERRAGPGDYANLLAVDANTLLAGDRLFALPTYTALIELRTLLSRRGLASEFWR